MERDTIIIGGGAAGFFAALSAKKAHPNTSVVIIEKTNRLLSKVLVSGGGRCNVTTSIFDPHALSKNYPRGEKELIGPFHHFGPKDTVQWFESRGVPLKIESDGRIFPKSNSSHSIIDTLMHEAKELGIEILLKKKIDSIEKKEDAFIIHGKESFKTKKLILASGSSREGHTFAQALGHSIITPVPSLFTFNVPSSPFLDLSGLSLNNVKLSIKEAKISQEGPLLLTHFGFSGPAALKLSAWGARGLYEKEYDSTLTIDWLPQLKDIYTDLVLLKKKYPNRSLFSLNPFPFPRKFWKTFLGQEKLLNDITHKELEELSSRLHSSNYKIKGKTTNKEEFVTCGGICLKEVNFKTMESKLCPGLFFAGEILDIDGITGGYNFQNAWTTGFIAGL